MHIRRFILALLLLFSADLRAQVDTAHIRRFIEGREPYEKQFITAIKNSDFNTALTFVSAETKAEIGEQILIAQLKKMQSYYKKYPKPEVKYSIGIGNNGVGTFGHDVTGSIELSCNYKFADKKFKDTYWITIFYTDAEPIKLIKFITYDDGKYTTPMKIAD